MQTHPTVTITRAAPADLPALLAIQKEAFQSEAERYDDHTITQLTETLADVKTALATTTATILKAEIDGAPVGAIRATRHDDTCEVGRLCVTPRHQRQGIGAALLLACETIFPETRVCELFTGHKSTDNIRLYERLGYRRIKEFTYPGFPKITVIHFQKPTANFSNHE